MRKAMLFYAQNLATALFYNLVRGKINFFFITLGSFPTGKRRLGCLI